MRYLFTLSIIFLSGIVANAQLQWKNVSDSFGSLPATIRVFRTNDALDGKPNIAYYVAISAKDRSLQLMTDTGKGKRYTPTQFYERNDHPLIVMNCTFFEFTYNRNLNLVMNSDKITSYNEHNFPLRGKDTFMYAHPFRSAIGIDKKRRMDIAWTFTDSSKRWPYALQAPARFLKDSDQNKRLDELKGLELKKWKMRTAFGGGPVLVQNGKISISNNEERQFGGNAINDKHPRTAIGYRPDGTMILLAVQGRYDKIAEGATLTQLAQIFISLGCIEAMNLDGGGSSCLLVNGKETIKPSDKAGEQRPVPAVFLVKKKN